MIIDGSQTYPDLLARLFPVVRFTKTRPQLFVKLGGDHNERLDAAAMLSWQPTGRSHFSVDLFVPEARRGEGHGTAMLRHVLDSARDHCAPRIRLARPVEDPKAISFFHEHGFDSVGRMTKWEWEVAKAKRASIANLERLARLVPPAEEIEILSYGGKYRGAIDRACLDRFGGLTVGHRRALGDVRDTGHDSSTSAILVHNGQYLISTGIDIHRGKALFDPVLAVEGVRNLWAFFYLAKHVFSKLESAGIRMAWGLIPNDHVTFTGMLEKSFDARAIGSAHDMELELEG